MRPRDAAQRFVGLVLRTTFGDMLDLADPHDGNHEANARARRAAYAEVETAVRRQFRVTHDLDALEHGVRLAAPEEQRTAVTKLTDAIADEFTVKQQSGYVVGIAVGRALCAAAAGEIGDGWTPPTP